MNNSNIHTIFNTTLRNIVLFISVSLSILGYSRYYRDKKNYIYNISFIFINIIFLLVSFYLTFILYNFITNNNEISKSSSDFLNIIYIMFGLIIIILTFSLFTLYRETIY
jgi:hypothetical protein